MPEQIPEKTDGRKPYHEFVAIKPSQLIWTNTPTNPRIAHVAEICDFVDGCKLPGDATHAATIAVGLLGLVKDLVDCVQREEVRVRLIRTAVRLNRDFELNDPEVAEILQTINMMNWAIDDVDGATEPDEVDALGNPLSITAKERLGQVLRDVLPDPTPEEVARLREAVEPVIDAVSSKSREE